MTTKQVTEQFIGICKLLDRDARAYVFVPQGTNEEELVIDCIFNKKLFEDAFNSLLSQVRQEASDSAYRERNQVVAALAKQFPSVVTKTDIPGWDPAWHNCVYITLPTGQASWHFHDNDSDLFRDIPRGEMKWDGHTTPEKYERLDKLKIGEASNETILGTHLNSQDYSISKK